MTYKNIQFNAFATRCVWTRSIAASMKMVTWTIILCKSRKRIRQIEGHKKEDQKKTACWSPSHATGTWKRSWKSFIRKFTSKLSILGTPFSWPMITTWTFLAIGASGLVGVTGWKFRPKNLGSYVTLLPWDILTKPKDKNCRESSWVDHFGKVGKRKERTVQRTHDS